MTGSPRINAEREAILALAGYRHPNIVDIVNIWIEQESFKSICYIQMELCSGDLYHFLERRYNVEKPDPLSELEAWNIFQQMMKGIEFIHSQGLVHRNIKPKNSNRLYDDANARSSLHVRPR